MNTNQKPQIVLLGLILFVGFILRFWDYWNIPFMFDELSAMGRTTYDNFSDLIRIGVVEKDSHPAGVQVLLYYWVKFVGDSEHIVKLPFLVAGLVSVWLSFKIGELWFGKTTGILTAAFVSSLQLFVMYSQIARPYISGLFITLLMALFWSKYFFRKPKIKYLVWFAVFGALAAYNHYFSLLFATTVGFSGLLLVNRKTIVPYVLSGVLILILYIPHLEIIFAQAEKGTIGGWLGEPGKYFILNFFYWLFHKSLFSYGLFLLIMLGGFLFGKPYGDEVPLKIKKRLILLIWLLPTPIFGYIFSYTVEPILQKSLLIFTTPYFFMLLFSFSGNLSWKKLSVAVVLILVVNSLTLIYVRDYYMKFYKQPFKNMAESATALEKRFPEDVFIINNYTPYYTEYYFNQSDITEVPFFTTRNANLTLVEFDSVVRNIDQNVVITSGLDDHYFQLIRKYFPNWIGYDTGFTFEQYTLSKFKPKDFTTIENQLIASTDFVTSTGEWSFAKENVRIDSMSRKPGYLFDLENEWGPKCSFSLDSVSTSGYVIIDVAIDLMPIEKKCDAVLVVEIKKGDEQISWRGFDFQKYNLKKGERQKFFATLDVQKALNNNMNIEGYSVNIFVWNPNHSAFWINEITISSRPGNRNRYDL